MEAGDTMTAGELFSGLVKLAVLSLLLSLIVLPLVSIRMPRARIPAGLLLTGFAVAFLLVGAWWLATGLPVRMDRIIVISAALIVGGILLFRWGRRTTAA